MNCDNSEQIQGFASQANLVWSILSAQAVLRYCSDTWYKMKHTIEKTAS